MIAYLKKGEILLADRGFCSFHAFGKMSQVGVDALMRLNDVRRVDLARRHRTQTVTLATTLLDPVVYPLQPLGELYL